MEWHVWLAYFVAAWVIALSPGSGAVLSMSHGLSYGVRSTTPTIVGLQIGLAVVLLVAGAGIGAVLMASAVAFTVVKVLGAGYLLWLGWRQWRAPVDADAATGMVAGEAALSVRQRVLRGALTNMTNPKGIVFMVAVLPQFIDPARPLWLQLLVLLATTVAVDMVVMHGYAWLASRLQRLLRSARARRSQNRVFGGVLMAMGASLFLVKRVSN
ncbi:LysE family transporter [Pseudorhodoferax sp. Leaf265]|jgi:homoserine/homoserine lactone efflux protein|uniref:LysE family transporter n=1 Tax=Pseudorhodoferax sp. Leaf265 TaxID=1736315 RepID=UPI0006F6F4A1|nr:LysE family transporter [Pseudorhodoferax sp. Leaf265]KQP02928.1 lysine transporter LysE [Pseudorhodoferax sp. Leaf265]PZP97831.1 MAG: lysine transporter LysE [Variovorax paradoxus]PZQ09125.1 MAG: lysine transporter LysE [Variovorax paradoxus]